jgi:hypothetical protein
MRRVLIGLVAALALAAVVGYARWFVPTQYAVGIGSGMLAKQVCSCLFVAERSLADCRADQFQSMDPIQVEVLSAPEGVRAFVPLFGERIATWREGLGCTLQ